MHTPKSASENADPNQDVKNYTWPVLGLVLGGGALTLAWIGFWLWSAYHLLLWAIG